MDRQYRQGDVLLVPTTLPQGATPVSTGRGAILARGEATGHAHAILDPVNVFALAGRSFIQADQAVTLRHEEHGPITVEPGIYEIRQQREWWGEWRQVRD